jgi:hypothetical protein
MTEDDKKRIKHAFENGTMTEVNGIFWEIITREQKERLYSGGKCEPQRIPRIKNS